MIVSTPFRLATEKKPLRRRLNIDCTWLTKSPTIKPITPICANSWPAVSMWRTKR